MATLTRKKRRVGLVTLWRDREGNWRARFQDPTSGRDVRRLVIAQDVAEAESWCWEMSRAILEGRGILPGLRSKRADTGVTVAEALATAIRVSRGQDRHKQRLRTEANNFVAWLAANHPTATAWRDVSRHIWREYAAAVEAAGLSYAGHKHRWEVLKAAARYWAAEEPGRYPNTLATAGIRLPEAPVTNPAVLTTEQLAGFLGWLERRAPDLVPLAALAGLAGTRMFEAAFLRVQDVDLDAGLVTVADVPGHRVKTANSRRTIPLAQPLVEILREDRARRAVQDVSPDAPAFRSTRGKAWTDQSIMARWTNVMLAARRELGPGGLPEGFAAHNLRATFTCIAQFHAGCDRQAVAKYCGRAPQDCMARHYEALPAGELRRLVVAPLESFLAINWQLPAAGSAQTAGVIAFAG